MEFRKMVTTTLYVRQQKRYRYKEQPLDSVGEGEGGMIWEDSIETYILSHVKQITSPGSMHETGHSGLVHWDDLRDGVGREVGGGVQDGEHMYTHGRFMSMYGKTIQYCKVISLRLKWVIKKSLIPCNLCHVHKCNNYCSWTYGPLLIRKASFTHKISKNSKHIVFSHCHILITNHPIESAKKKHIQCSFLQLFKIIIVSVHFKTLRYKNLIQSKFLVAYFISARENQICW